MSKAYPLAGQLQQLRSGSADELLEGFLEYVAALKLDLYPAQEEAVLELFAGKHVILATPTGSGKSLVAFAMIFRALAHGGRAFYTCPIKALVNEKFFQLGEAFGPAMVGMMTGDATINPTAPIICCTAEIASSMTLREGIGSSIDALIMDEFHYYGDRERGSAWQIPLLVLARTHFLLMSATLGDVTPFLGRLTELTKRPAVLVESTHRPVPLDFNYSEEPLLDALRNLVQTGKSPVYVVCFTQRNSAEQAQNLMSENFTTKEEKKLILEEIAETHFDTPYGKDVLRFVKQGIGLHHAGLLPKYRLLSERLAQKGLLKVICGTDTLGVGVNIPIRTVLFTKLCKFDGEKVGILTAREFHQIAGRAGRKGFDNFGTVVVQAPEHAIENLKIDRKKDSDPKKYKNLQRAKPPVKGYVHWDRATYDKLLLAKPEPLVPRFNISHGMLVDLLDSSEPRKRGGYGALLELIEKSHLREFDKKKERKLAPQLFRSLRRAGIVELVPRPSGKRGKLARVSDSLQRDFSMHNALALWLIEFIPVLHEGRVDEESYALDVLSAVEAILENPKAILERQVDKLKGEKLNELKAAGVEYEERMAELEKVEYEKPLAEVIYATFNEFSKHHPWVSSENIRPKSIVRAMFQQFLGFNQYVRDLDLARSEGLLLRYITDALRTLEQSVPEALKNDALDDAIHFLRSELRIIDSSLLDEWDARLNDGGPRKEIAQAEFIPLARDAKRLLVTVRSELHRLLKCLSDRDWLGASALLANAAEWPPEKLEAALAPYFEERKAILCHHEARKAEFTTLRTAGDCSWDAWQTLVDPERENDWRIEATVSLDPELEHAPARFLNLLAVTS
jgi:superfamily II RNA helicase